jgi:hypothetical protein
VTSIVENPEVFGYWTSYGTNSYFAYGLELTPATVQPATVQPATVQPATVQPATVQPATVETEAALEELRKLAREKLKKRDSAELKSFLNSLSAQSLTDLQVSDYGKMLQFLQKW